MALRKKEPPEGPSGASLRRLIARVEQALNSEKQRMRENFPLIPMVEKPIVGREPRKREKPEQVGCPVYIEEEGHSVAEEDEGEPGGEKEELVDIAAKVRFPGKGMGSKKTGGQD